MKKFLDYTNFRKNYKLNYQELEERDGCIYFEGELVANAEKQVAEGEKFLNVGYKLDGSVSKVLSNLFPMSFWFRGKKVASLEGVLQGIKYKDKKTQNLVLKYSGMDAHHTRGCNEIDYWANDGIVYWQGKPINRHGEEYQLFIDELYFSVIKNPLYRRALLSSGDKYLLHHVGKNYPSETVLTRREFELRLNSLRDYIKTVYNGN